MYSQKRVAGIFCQPISVCFFGGVLFFGRIVFLLRLDYDSPSESSHYGNQSICDTSMQAVSGNFNSSSNLLDQNSSPRPWGTRPAHSGETISASTSESASVNFGELGSDRSSTTGRRRTSAYTRSAAAYQSVNSDAQDDGSANSIGEAANGNTNYSSLEEEYVVMIRPIDVSGALTTLGTRAPMTSLSKASMVKHNKQQKVETILTRNRSPSGSSGSGDNVFDTGSNTSSSSNGHITSGLTSKQSSSSNSDSRSNSEDGMNDVNDSNSSNDNDE